MTTAREHRAGSGGERGQASLLLLGMIAALLASTLILFSFGQALGARSKHQRAADLAAVSAAQAMRRYYPRLFEYALLENGAPNPRHLSNAGYLALARAAALRGARRNGVRPGLVHLSVPGAGFAPTRVTVAVRGEALIGLPGERRSATRVGGAGRARRAVPVRARATAELAPELGDSFGMPGHGSAGGYDGPLAYRVGKPMRSAAPGRASFLVQLSRASAVARAPASASMR